MFQSDGNQLNQSIAHPKYIRQHGIRANLNIQQIRTPFYVDLKTRRYEIGDYNVILCNRSNWMEISCLFLITLINYFDNIRTGLRSNKNRYLMI